MELTNNSRKLDHAITVFGATNDMCGFLKYVVQGVFFIAGLSTAERPVSCVATRLLTLLYGEQSGDKKYFPYVQH
jgi:hypothetical protein